MKINIIKEFEQLSLSEKIDFLGEYDIADDFRNREYFTDFIKNFNDSNDVWTLSLIVDVAADLQINDVSLFQKYFDYVTNSVNYMLKLSVLDFQLDTYNIYYPNQKELFIQYEPLLNKKYERLIVRNQILLNLMIYRKENRLKYQNLLKNNLKKTRDYRSHLRVYNTLLNYPFFNFVTRDYIFQLIDITEKWDFDRAVQSKIEEVKLMWIN